MGEYKPPSSRESPALRYRCAWVVGRSLAVQDTWRLLIGHMAFDCRLHICLVVYRSPSMYGDASLAVDHNRNNHGVPAGSLRTQLLGGLEPFGVPVIEQELLGGSHLVVGRSVSYAAVSHRPQFLDYGDVHHGPGLLANAQFNSLVCK